jgi:hypothetical protein
VKEMGNENRFISTERDLELREEEEEYRRLALESLRLSKERLQQAKESLRRSNRSICFACIALTLAIATIIFALLY